MTHYNTTHLTGKALAKEIDNAKTQEDKILAFFNAKPHGNYTPDEVRDLTGINAPITSIRRAITNLTSYGYINKTHLQRPGRYGKITYAWELA